MKLSLSVVVIAVGLTGCVSHNPYQASDVFSQLVGTWDEVHANSCKNAHELSFDDKKTTMLLTYSEVGWVTETDSRKVFRYKILSTTQTSLRVQLEREPRLDDHGNPVVWHITPIDGDTYCWGRDDWPQGACTPPRKRCGT
jgi:hypothetical protein